MRMLSLVGCFVGVWLASAMPVAAQDANTAVEWKVAGFSFQRALNESARGQAAIARVEAIREQKSRELETRNQALADRVATFQRSLGTLSAASRRQQQADLERFQLDTERFLQDAQAEFAGVQHDEQAAFLVVLRPALEHVVREKGIHVLVDLDDKSRVLWADPQIDITGDVVLALNVSRE